MKIAVLLATYNRKAKTLACLHNLMAQELPAGVYLDIFLTDDASPDGTAEAVRTQFPGVNLYQGSGSLFWAGGMRNSWREALASGAEYYLLLNDDTFLAPGALKTLLRHSRDYQRRYAKYAILVGTTQDPDSGKVSYGGRKLYSKWRIQSYLVQGLQDSVECDMAEANIMLVPEAVVSKIGILSDRYTHFFGDYDYTLRAIKSGFKVVAPPGIYGVCKDDHGRNWKPAGAKLSERLQFLYSPKGLSYKEYIYFMRQHFPLQTPSALFKVWLKTLAPFVYDWFKTESA